jgi:hypothetical protein
MTTIKNPTDNNKNPKEKKCIYNTIPNNIKKALNAVLKGHGLASTI